MLINIPSYFVDPDSDEIRLISAPSYYLNYFISKNVRHNDRQRFAFTTAVQDQLIRPRLEALGLVRLALPLGTNPAAAADKPHVPIYVSADLAQKKRVVVIFGESEQELGVIAHRVVGGRGGVDKGSMVGIVKALQGQGQGKGHNDKSFSSSSTSQDHDHDHDDDSPGIILANTGELWWWPEGRRGLTARQSHAVPMRSCVHWGRFYDAAANAVPGHASVDQHVASVFEGVLDNPDLVGPGAEVQVVGVTDGAVAAEAYLDRNWGRWAGRVGCLAMLGAGVDAASLKSEEFKVFLREKSRLYITCQEPLGTAISGPEGNPNTTLVTSYGCPVLSSGEAFYSEMTLVRARDAVLAWLEEAHGAGAGYTNPQLAVTFADEKFEEAPAWRDDPDLVGPAATATATAAAGGGYGRGDQGPQGGGAGGLEIITREEWEARMEKEGKESNAPEPEDVYVVGKREEED